MTVPTASPGLRQHGSDFVRGQNLRVNGGRAFD
jgi:hypothetical protein